MIDYSQLGQAIADRAPSRANLPALLSAFGPISWMVPSVFQSSRNGEYRVSGAEVQTPRPGDQGFVRSILNGAVDSGSWSREQAQMPRSMPRSMPQTRGYKS